jgi:hypothetical protein
LAHILKRHEFNIYHTFIGKDSGSVRKSKDHLWSGYMSIRITIKDLRVRAKAKYTFAIVRFTHFFSLNEHHII